jgi:hypothetical protein
MFEKFKDSNKFQEKKKEKKEPDNAFDITSLVSIKDLPSTHFARRYIEKRQIPEKYWGKLFYTENYKKWVNDFVIPKKFEHPPIKDERIVIPFYAKSGNPFAFQGRYIGQREDVERYVTIKNNDNLLVYGFDTVDISKTIYLFEGPLDSMFINNSLAAAGSSLSKLINSELDLVFCFDNEKRAKEIVELMEKIIKHGRKIVIWDNTYDAKDINDIIIKYSLTEEQLMKYLKKRTFQGLTAQLEFGKFKKI